MRYVFDHDYHIHSQISLCSGHPEQTAERILQYARENDLKRICVTDHFWDEKVPVVNSWYEKQNYDWIAKILPLPKADGIDFMFGAETEMDKDTRIGMAPETYGKFDFVIVPTTHLNNVGFGLSEEDAQTVEGRAKVWLEKLNGLLYKDLPFHKMGVAHLVCGLIVPKKRDELLQILSILPEAELKKSFRRAADVGIGIELNSDDMGFKDEEAETVLRVFRIAKSCGCKFYLGSDAHSPKDLEKAKGRFERAIDYLELKESDKFYIKK